MSNDHQEKVGLGSEVNEAGSGSRDSSLSRRKVLKAAMLAPPVLMSLTSRPVHAVQGLSNMLSGDASQCRGDVKYGGMSPGFWKHYDDQGGTDFYGDRHNVAWDITGYLYGTFNPASTETQAYKRFNGGTFYDDVFGGGYPGMTLREVLNEGSGTEGFHLIAGLLNALYYENKAGGPGGTTLYFMTSKQFWDMYDGQLSVPVGYSSLRDLIESSYHLAPGSAC